MNKVISKLFVAIRYDDRKVVYFDTNLKSFIDGCHAKANISGLKGLSYYQYTFRNQETIHHVDSFGKMFYLQKVF
ncbi:hypothetical protein [Allomuricauda sp. d1]|uniref:hypothetical protein n=1 Tax=Allomuricauda sp. d1 TaxID=3136725 RepID=UPI0031D298A9